MPLDDVAGDAPEPAIEVGVDGNLALLASLFPEEQDPRGPLVLKIAVAEARHGADPREMPLFRSALGKRKKHSAKPLSAHSMSGMLKRRLKDAGLPGRTLTLAHSWRWVNSMQGETPSHLARAAGLSRMVKTSLPSEAPARGCR